MRRPKGTGTFDKSNGYTKIEIKKRRIYIHRAVMEQILGRKLLKNEQVHHKNGNRLDNRIENLQVFTQAEHLKLHKTKHPIIDGIKKTCGNCFEIKYLGDFNKRKSDLGYTTMCKECNKIKCREWKKRVNYKKK